MDNVQDLQVLLASRYPLIVARDQDELRILDTVRRTADALHLPVWTWTATQGLARDGRNPQYATADPHQALDWVANLDQAGVFVFADLGHLLDDRLLERRLKDVAMGLGNGQTLVLTGTEQLPDGLATLAVPWSLKPPGAAELRAAIGRTTERLALRGIEAQLTEDDVVRLVTALAGMSVPDAERVITRAALRDGRLRGNDIPFVLAAKVELLDRDGVLEVVDPGRTTLGDLGGFEALGDWLALRQGRAVRGILLTGVPGCGKSAAAKAIAAAQQVPLLLLDPSRLYRPYIGESEQRLERALGTIDAMAPAVLWIDEIEKGFATGRSDTGVSRRLLGTFLRWMQERPDGAFLVATANDVRALPPELLRKGRFDEIFFVDLPDPVARRAIFRFHIEKRDHDPEALDIERLAAAADGFSGAEIEAAVVSATYRADASGRLLDDEALLGELAATVPLSVSRHEEIAALRAWARDRAVAA